MCFVTFCWDFCIWKYSHLSESLQIGFIQRKTLNHQPGQKFWGSLKPVFVGNMTSLGLCVQFLNCWFLFDELVIFFSLWCLSMTLQVLKFYRSKLPSSPLFSVATKHSEYISSLSVSQVRHQSHTQPSEKTELWTHVLILSLPLEGETSSCAFYLDHVLMC